MAIRHRWQVGQAKRRSCGALLYRTGRDRVALLFGMAVVNTLAQALTEQHIEPGSWLGLGIITPTLVIAAVLIGVILHGGCSRS